MKRTTEPLSEHTWLKVGGTAEIAVPQSKSELVDLLQDCSEDGVPYRILGNGSNLLAHDDGVDELVVKTTEACTEFEASGTRVTVGASMMIPQFVNNCIQCDLCGCEYLYSVPGTVGGAIYMNAGRGRSHDQTISDHLVAVEVYDGDGVREFDADDLEFEHRYSSFHERDDWVILSATFDMPEQPEEVGREKAQERMQKVDERERSLPNAGSVFKTGARFPVQKLPGKGLSVGDARFVAQNRICHSGDATYEDIRRLIGRAKLFNRLVPPFEEPEVEWKIWK